MSTVRKLALGSMLFLSAAAVPVMAQNNPGGGGGMNNGGGGGGGGGGRGNFQQMRQQMMDNLKTQLGASDDEFAAMQPKIEKVFTLQRETQGQGMRALFGGGRGGRGGRGGGNNGGGGTGGPGGPGGDQPSTPMSAATTALKDTLDNKDSKPDDIKAKLDAFRAAKAQAKDEMTKAQEDLKGVLTQRQEAVLVELGLLD